MERMMSMAMRSLSSGNMMPRNNGNVKRMAIRANHTKSISFLPPSPAHSHHHVGGHHSRGLRFPLSHAAVLEDDVLHEHAETAHYEDNEADEYKTQDCPLGKEDVVGTYEEPDDKEKAVVPQVLHQPSHEEQKQEELEEHNYSPPGTTWDHPTQTCQGFRNNLRYNYHFLSLH